MRWDGVHRYDMLCLEGIARALNIFNRPTACSVTYQLADMSQRQPLKLTIKPETALVRPFMVAAVLRGLNFDATRYKSFIDLQVCCFALQERCLPILDALLVTRVRNLLDHTSGSLCSHRGNSSTMWRQ